MKQYDPIGFRISETAMYIKKFIDINAQKEGLSSTELKIFKFLSFNKDKDITQNDICEFTKFKPSTISVALDQMEANGYISRVKSENDGRKTLIKLTEKGVNKNESIKAIFDLTEKVIDNLLTKEELDQLYLLLEKVKNGIKEEMIL